MSSLINARHGFFTRHGGVSKGVFASLNCGYRSPEPPEIIAQNRALIATHLKVPSTHLFTVTQTHSTDVYTVNAPAYYRNGVKADAMVSKGRGLALGVLTADCAPVLFHDQEAGVIGAAHAGWRGAFHGILEATVSAMKALGAQKVKAAVGPCISQKNYEVGPEFFETFCDENRNNSRYFTQGPKGKYLFDLPVFILHRLRAAGVDAEWTGQCTYANPDNYYSFRYSRHNNLPSYGRMLSAIAT